MWETFYSRADLIYSPRHDKVVQGRARAGQGFFQSAKACCIVWKFLLLQSIIESGLRIPNEAPSHTRSGGTAEIERDHILCTFQAISQARSRVIEATSTYSGGDPNATVLFYIEQTTGESPKRMVSRSCRSLELPLRHNKCFRL